MHLLYIIVWDMFWNPIRVSARKKFMGRGQLENTNLLKKGICLLNTFLKDFTKMPIKKNTVLQFDGGLSHPCQNHEGDKSPPLYETLPICL